jgi:hypothetical protein
MKIDAPGTARRIRWRLHEPTERNTYRWSKVHRLSVHAGDLTVCHRIIPAHAYDVAYDEWIPDDAPECTQCKRDE